VIDGEGGLDEGAEGERCQRTSAPRYRAWLLRSWAVPGPRDPVDEDRRYSLEDPHTGARRGFAGLVALVAYLLGEPGEDEAPPRPTGERPGGWNGVDHRAIPAAAGDSEGPVRPSVTSRRGCR
jgi:hypothetical protein